MTKEDPRKLSEEQIEALLSVVSLGGQDSESETVDPNASTRSKEQADGTKKLLAIIRGDKGVVESGPIKPEKERLPLFVDAETLPSLNHTGHNEDRILNLEEKGVFAVFDGMGGVSNGEKAAATAHDFFAQKISELLDHNPDLTEDSLKELLLQAITQTHENLWEVKNQDFSLSEMGTTAAAVKIWQQPNGQFQAVAVNVGDSRVYLRSADGQLTQITTDHAFAGKETQVILSQVDSQEKYDQLDEVQKKGFNNRSGIAQHIGMVNKDRYRFNPEIFVFPVKPGDQVILTSDGVHDNLTDQEIAQALNSQYAQPARALAKAALVRSAQGKEKHIRSKKDDISAIVVTVDAAASTQSKEPLLPDITEAVSEFGVQPPLTPEPQQTEDAVEENAQISAGRDALENRDILGYGLYTPTLERFQRFLDNLSQEDQVKYQQEISAVSKRLNDALIFIDLYNGGANTNMASKSGDLEKDINKMAIGDFYRSLLEAESLINDLSRRLAAEQNRPLPDLTVPTEASIKTEKEKFPIGTWVIPSLPLGKGNKMKLSPRQISGVPLFNSHGDKYYPLGSSGQTVYEEDIERVITEQEATEILTAVQKNPLVETPVEPATEPLLKAGQEDLASHAKKYLAEQFGYFDIEPEKIFSSLTEAEVGQFTELLRVGDKSGMVDFFKSAINKLLISERREKELSDEMAQKIAEELEKLIIQTIELQAISEANKLNLKKAGSLGLAMVKNYAVIAGTVAAFGALGFSTAGIGAVGAITAASLGLRRWMEHKKKKGQPQAEEKYKQDLERAKEEVLGSFANDVNLKAKLSGIIANQLREQTGGAALAQVKSFALAELETAEQETAQKLELRQRKIFESVLSYVRLNNPDASPEQIQSMAVVMAMTLGMHETTDRDAADQLAKIKADKEGVFKLIEKFNQARFGAKPKGVDENVWQAIGRDALAVGIGTGVGMAIRTNEYARVLMGAVTGATFGHAIGGWLDKKAEEKGMLAIDSMITSSEAKIKDLELPSDQVNALSQDATFVASKLEMGLLDKNLVLLNRAKNFIYNVRQLELKNQTVLTELLGLQKKNTDALAGQLKGDLKTLEKSVKNKRRWGAAIGAVLGAAGAEAAIHYFGHQRPEASHQPDLEAKQTSGIDPHAVESISQQNQHAIDFEAQKNHIDYSQPTFMYSRGGGSVPYDGNNKLVNVEGRWVPQDEFLKDHSFITIGNSPKALEGVIGKPDAVLLGDGKGSSKIPGAVESKAGAAAATTVIVEGKPVALTPEIKAQMKTGDTVADYGEVGKGESVSEALNKAMAPDATVTVINPDGQVLLGADGQPVKFDANLAHEGDQVFEIKHADGSKEIFVQKAGVTVKEGQSLAGRYDEIQAKFKLDEISDEVKNKFNADKGEGGFHERLNYQEAQAARAYWDAHPEEHIGTGAGHAPGGVTVITGEELKQELIGDGASIETTGVRAFDHLDLNVLENGDKFYVQDSRAGHSHFLLIRDKANTVSYYQIGFDDNLTPDHAGALIVEAKIASHNLTEFSQHLGEKVERVEAVKFYQVYDQADDASSLAEYKTGDANFKQLDNFLSGLKDKNISLLKLDGRYSLEKFTLTADLLKNSWQAADISDCLARIKNQEQLTIALELRDRFEHLAPEQMTRGLAIAERLNLNPTRELAFALIAARTETDFGMEDARRSAGNILGINFEATHLIYNRTDNQIRFDGLTVTDGSNPRHDVIFDTQHNKIIISDIGDGQEYDLSNDELNRLGDYLKENPVEAPPAEVSAPATPEITDTPDAEAAPVLEMSATAEAQNKAIRQVIEAAAAKVIRSTEELVYQDLDGDNVADTVGLAVGKGRPYFTMALPKEIGEQEQLDVADAIKSAQENLDKTLKSLNQAPGISASREQAAEFMPIAQRLNYKDGANISQGLARAFEATAHTKGLSFEKDLVIASLAQYREGLSDMSDKQIFEAAELLFGKSIEARDIHFVKGGNSETLIFEGTKTLTADHPNFTVILELKNNHFSILNQKGNTAHTGALTDQELNNIPAYLRGETPPAFNQGEQPIEDFPVQPLPESKITPLPSAEPTAGLLRGLSEGDNQTADNLHNFTITNGKITAIDGKTVALGVKSDGQTAFDENSAIYTRTENNAVYNYSVIKDSSGQITIIEQKHELPGFVEPEQKDSGADSGSLNLPDSGYEISTSLADEVGKPYNIGSAGYDCMTLVRQAARENRGEYPVLDSYDQFLRTHAGKPEELKFSVFLKEQPLTFKDAAWQEVKQKLEPGEYLINMESGGGPTYGPEGHGAILTVTPDRQFIMYHASTASIMPEGGQQPISLHELTLEIDGRKYHGREIVEQFKAAYKDHITDRQADGSKLYDKWLADHVKFFNGQGNAVKAKLEPNGSLRLGYVTKETNLDSYFKYNQDFSKNIDVLPLTKETPVLAKAA